MRESDGQVHDLNVCACNFCMIGCKSAWHRRLVKGKPSRFAVLDLSTLMGVVSLLLPWAASLMMVKITRNESRKYLLGYCFFLLRDMLIFIRHNPCPLSTDFSSTSSRKEVGCIMVLLVFGR